MEEGGSEIHKQIFVALQICRSTNLQKDSVKPNRSRHRQGLGPNLTYPTIRSEGEYVTEGG